MIRKRLMIALAITAGIFDDLNNPLFPLMPRYGCDLPITC